MRKGILGTVSISNILNHVLSLESFECVSKVASTMRRWFTPWKKGVEVLSFTVEGFKPFFDVYNFKAKSICFKWISDQFIKL